MTTSSILILVSVIIYLIGMMYIGFRYSNNKTSEDFYLGGRKLGPIVTAMSTEASDMSAYLLMGVPGLAMFCGIAEASWTAIGLAAKMPVSEGKEYISACTDTLSSSTLSLFPTIWLCASGTIPSSLRLWVL